MSTIGATTSSTLRRLRAESKRRANQALTPVTNDIEDMYDRVKKRARSSGPAVAIKSAVDNFDDKADAWWDSAPAVAQVATAPFIGAVDIARGLVDTVLPETATEKKVQFSDQPRPILKRRHRVILSQPEDGPKPESSGVDPGALTAMQMAVEKNPGPKSRKGSRKTSRKRTARPRRSRKPGHSDRHRSARMSSTKKFHPKGHRAQTVSGSKMKSGNGVIFQRRDLVFSGTTSATAVTGDVIYQALINPTGEGNTATPNARGINAAMLQYEAAKWENFDCDVVFTVEANGSKFVQGTFIMGIEMDVTDNIPTGTAGVQRLTLQGGKVFEFSTGGTHGYSSINKTRAVKEYWVQQQGSDARLCAKGKFILMTNQPATVYNGSTATKVAVPVQVFATYKFRFRNATLEPAGTSLLSAGGGMLWTSTATGSNLDPFSLSGAVANTYNTMIGAVRGSDGTDGYLLFPEGSDFDLVSQLACTLQSKQSTTAAVTVTAVAGAVLASQYQVVQTTSGVVDCQFITLANATTAITLSNAYKCVAVSAGGQAWQQQLGSVVYQCWGGVKYHSTGATYTSGSVGQVNVTQAYSPSLVDKQLLQAGPGADEYRYIQTWQYNMPLDEHIREQRAAEAHEAGDVEYLKRRIRDMQEAKSLGLEPAGRDPPNTPRPSPVRTDDEYLARGWVTSGEDTKSWPPLGAVVRPKSASSSTSQVDRKTGR